MMIKNIFNLFIVFILSGNTIYADENNSTKKATQLEMFLFKIGFTSMLHDIKNQKTNITSNTNDIKILQQKIDYIIQELDKLKSDQQANILNSYKQQLIHNQDNSNVLYSIDTQSINIRQYPSLKSKIIGQITFNQKIKISFCNKYKWCKLADQNGYVAKFLLHKIEY